MIRLPAYLTGYNRKADRSASVRFETQELSTEALVELDKHYQLYGWLVFQENEVKTQDLPTEQAEDTPKTPSKRLRATLFVLWQQGGRVGDFEAFYREKMEKLIDHIKARLD